MAILVTGGAGYVGAHVVLELLDHGEDVTVLDNLSTGFRWAIPPEAELVVGDVGDERLVTAVIASRGIEAVIHCAAKTVVPDSVALPLDYYLNNTAKTRALLECVVKQGVRRFIFSSTAAVYGDPACNPVTEEEYLQPISPYGRSKLMVEWMLSDAAQAHDLRYVVLRYFNVAGADPKGRAGQSTPRATHLIKVAVQAALGERDGMDVLGIDYPTPDGSCVRDYIQVTDLARAHLQALHHLRSGGTSLTCNCGYGHGYSVLEVVEMVRKVARSEFPVKVADRRPGDSAAIIAANERIKNVLGWRPEHDDLEEIVLQALNWERQLQASCTRSAPEDALIDVGRAVIGSRHHVQTVEPTLRARGDLEIVPRPAGSTPARFSSD